MRKIAILFTLTCALVGLEPSAARAGFILGDASTFGVLYEGDGSHHLQTTNVTVNGNIGIGAPSGSTTAEFKASGPGVINGSIFFAQAVHATLSNTTLSGAITGFHGNVQADLNALNKLSASLGTEAGSGIAINTGGSGGSRTINAAAGTLDAGGNRVFSVTSMQFNNQTTLNIQGDAAGHPVVFNFRSGAQFGGAIVLSGLTSDQVLFNITGGAGRTGGNTLQLNTNGALLTGTFLDPNGAISVVHTRLTGRVFGGDRSDMQIVSGDTLNAPHAAVDTAPVPSSIALLLSAAIPLALLAWHRRRLGIVAG
jgi:hypothetical protein